MSTAAANSTSELLADLRRLCNRLPVPQPDWHPYVAKIAACRDDFEHALALAADAPQTLDLVAALVDGDLQPAFDEVASAELATAWRRLEALPLPSGQHPYLDEILPALEAHRLLLVALSQTIAH